MSEPSDLKKFRERQQTDGEDILEWVPGWIGKLMGQGDDRQRNGVLIVTDRRVVFYLKGLMTEVIEAIDLKKVSSVEHHSTLMHNRLRIYTSGDDLDFKCSDKDRAKRIRDLIEERRGGGLAEASEAAGESITSQLERLAALKENGILTDEEFTAQKVKLLG